MAGSFYFCEMRIDKLKLAKLILRLGIAGTFLGHGYLAMQVQSSWIPFLITVGFDTNQAIILMPIIGALDIAIAITTLLYPIKIVLIWAVIWAFSTALMRPLSGMEIWPFIERSSFWAAPLALLLMNNLPKKFSDLFRI